MSSEPTSCENEASAAALPANPIARELAGILRTYQRGLQVLMAGLATGSITVGLLYLATFVSLSLICLVQNGIRHG